MIIRERRLNGKKWGCCKIDEYIYGAAAPFCAKNEKAGSEEPAIHGIINYVE